MKNMLKVLRIILVLTAAMQVSAGAPENDQEIHENPDRMKYRPLTIQDSINDRFPYNPFSADCSSVNAQISKSTSCHRKCRQLTKYSVVTLCFLGTWGRPSRLKQKNNDLSPPCKIPTIMLSSQNDPAL
jgi:hypothetical protein